MRSTNKNDGKESSNIGSPLFYGVFLIIATLIVDILYGVIDPRVNIADSKE